MWRPVKPRQFTSDRILLLTVHFQLDVFPCNTTDRFTYSQTYLEHGYKGVDDSPNCFGWFLPWIPTSSYHPRGSFMLIALPNMDKTFTLHAVLPPEGNIRLIRSIQRRRWWTFQKPSRMLFRWCLHWKKIILQIRLLHWPSFAIILGV